MNSRPLFWRRRDLLGATAALVGLGHVPKSIAQSYPIKPVKMVLPFSPGGTADVVGRLLGTKLQERLGQPVVIEARAGANGIIGTDFVAKAEPDGYTLLLNSSAQALNQSLYRKLPYDAKNGFVPVALVVPAIPFVIAVHSSVPASNIQELIAWAKAHPGQLTYGSAGTGSTLHLGAAMLEYETGSKFLHVPYKGAAPATTDLAGGQIMMLFISYGAVLTLVKEGRVKVLAQTGIARSPLITTVPTVSEAGGPIMDYTAWYGLYAPANTPRDVVSKLNAAAQWAMAQQDVTSKLAPLGAISPDKLDPEQFAAFHRKTADAYARMVKGANLEMDAGT